MAITINEGKGKVYPKIKMLSLFTYGIATQHFSFLKQKGERQFFNTRKRITNLCQATRRKILKSTIKPLHINGSSIWSNIFNSKPLFFIFLFKVLIDWHFSCALYNPQSRFISHMTCENKWRL